MADYSISKKKVLAAGLGLLLMVLGAIFLLNFPAYTVTTPLTFGATFSPQYAQSLGLDWKEVYQATLDDLGVKEFRFPVYWNRTEGTKDQYDFSDTDYELDEANKRGVKVLLAVGRKLPRWPECYDPSWLLDMPQEDQRDAQLLTYVKDVVDRYKDNPAVYGWQVENEPFFPFGTCLNLFSKDIFAKEIAVVRTEDPGKPITVTEGGEWDMWFGAAYYADRIGISMYRSTWNSSYGQIFFPIGPGWYQLRAGIMTLLNKPVFVSELQVEPWGPKTLQDMTLDEYHKYFPLSEMRSNIEFARKVGFEKNYLWGVEWWYLARQRGDSSYWDEGRNIFKGE